MLLEEAGQMATVLVALAVREGKPSQMRVGKETSVPPPATELIAPARKAEPKATVPCGKSRGVMKTSAYTGDRFLRPRLGLESCKRRYARSEMLMRMLRPIYNRR